MMPNSEFFEVSVEEEIADASMGKPHVVLLGAGASRAALPNGDKNGTPVPLLREVAKDLALAKLFPADFQALAVSDFEAAYSRLFERGPKETVAEIDSRVSDYFSQLQLPDEANLYDLLHLCLRGKDAIFTFNWDPFLMQARSRLANLGRVPSFPQMFFLHGNVTVGFCAKDRVSGVKGAHCNKCREPFTVSRLLFPVEKKNYQDAGLIEREWQAVRAYLKDAFMLTVFGYSAPVTDIEAVTLLKEGWGDLADRNTEQTEIINRPGSDHDALSKTWESFIHTHHYEIHDSFYESWLANHPRRSGEAHWNQYFEAKFISNNPAPQPPMDIKELVDWFQPLFDAEKD